MRSVRAFGWGLIGWGPLGEARWNLKTDIVWIPVPKGKKSGQPVCIHYH